ncbi:polysaccharide pyruvyl transferase family protein [Planctomicrobium piriforme]|uniref:Polysaccharide pyruvyl transferase n=1 Tax=Planctomicrobium piriforme TaxID=1576369 RepID=A0A1I3N8B9_9PLAN|nr:polysaccharide pyruvyl transferase family protein [Planctomicrobium piriforme]SFJ05561.1 Polysaccharide pyruvyl transferase [Planctomicrobium piriforme]
MSQTRRTFLQASTLSAIGLMLPGVLRAQAGEKPRILLRSSWQIVNIGDIAHTPGVIALIEKYIPEAEVILWASNDLSPEVLEMEHKRFPKLKVVKGKIKDDGHATTPELEEALGWCNFLLHGSGASFVAQRDVGDFVKHIGKPYGVYGITYSGTSKEGIDLLTQARFLFFRETVSLERAKEDGVQCPIMEFGPDGAFGTDLRNDKAADEYLKSVDLQPGKFLCCIPRLRYTPYWLIRNQPKDEKKADRNEMMQEHDHAPLRAAISAVVRETDTKVLICPEDMTQMAVGRELLYNRLDDDVKAKVVLRETYWLTDEALSTYMRSLGLFGLEMHSPIMCIANGVPALVGRFEEQTSKGFMWRDIGLGDWLFDMDQPDDVARLTPTLLTFVQDRPAVLEKVRKAQAIVQQRQRETMQVLKQQFAAAPVTSEKGQAD